MPATGVVCGRAEGAEGGVAGVDGRLGWKLMTDEAMGRERLPVGLSL